jgi:hypothetical protein
LNRKQGFDFWRAPGFQAWRPISEVANVLPNFGLCREPNGNLSRAPPLLLPRNPFGLIDPERGWCVKL